MLSAPCLPSTGGLTTLVDVLIEAQPNGFVRCPERARARPHPAGRLGAPQRHGASAAEDCGTPLLRPLHNVWAPGRMRRSLPRPPRSKLRIQINVSPGSI